MIDCTHARLSWTLQRRQADELDAPEAAALERHLEDCAECLSWTKHERQADEAVAAAVRAVPVPEQLPARVLQRLRGTPAPRRFRASHALAAAAALLLAAATGLYFWLTAPGPLYVENFIEDERYVPVSTADLETLDEQYLLTMTQWYADQDVPVTLPDRLRYSRLERYDIDTKGGRRVARLQFFHRGNSTYGPARADVYIVPTRHFDGDRLVQSLDSAFPTASGHTIRVYDEKDAGFVTIIVYTGESVRPFVEAPPGDSQ